MADYNTVSDQIVLGSGELYLAFMSDLSGIDLNNDAQLIPKLTMVGAIESGATITYKPTETTVQPDNRPFLYYRTEDQATFKTGVLNFSPENVGFVMPVTTKSLVNGKKLTVGGNAKTPVLFLRFIHKEDNGNVIQVDMTTCYANNGSSFAFNRTKATDLDMEFTTTMVPGHDDSGHGVMEISFIDTNYADNLPTVAVSGMSFTDTNSTVNEIAGTLTWTAPDDVSNVTGYNIYLLDSDNRKVGDALGTVAKGTSTFIIQNTIVGGATQLAVFAYNGYGESQYSTKLAITDVKA